MLAAGPYHLLVWVVVGTVTLLVTTVLAGRLLGTRRGWVALTDSGRFGRAAAVVVAGDLTGCTVVGRIRS